MRSRRIQLAIALFVATLALGLTPARAQSAGDRDEDDVAKRVRAIEKKLEGLDHKLDRVLALLEKSGVAGKAEPSKEAPPAPTSLFVKEKEIPLAGEGSWDYVTLDPVGARLYVAHLTQLDVIDTRKSEKIGEVTGLDGSHGTAIVPELKRGFATSGKNNKLLVFDLDTLKVTNEVATGEGPDCVIYVASQGEIWAMNHRGGTITCVDPKTLEVRKTIWVGGTLEFAREDLAKGLVYVNVEDTDKVVTIDAKKHEPVSVASVAPGKAPAGLAFDPKSGLLFVGCDNKKLVVMEAATGKVVTALESGEHCDGCAFDPETGNVFASCRGASWAFREKDGRTVEVLGALEAGKTCTLDPTTHKLYVTAGTRGEKDSVKVLVYAPAASGH